MWHDLGFAERYNSGFARKVAPVVAGRLIERAAPRAGERVLECACGTGACTTLLEKAAGRDSRFVACDRSPAMLSIAARRLRAADSHGTRARLCVQDMQCLAFRSGSFDLVVSNLGLHVMPDRGQALREATRVLREGGRMAWSVPGDWSLEPFQTWYWELVAGPAYRSALTVPAKSWSPREAEATLKADRDVWTAVLVGAGVASVVSHVEQMTIWFLDAAEFFSVGPFGHTRRALDALSDDDTRDAVKTALAERLDATATEDGVPIRVTTLCFTGEKA